MTEKSYRSKGLFSIDSYHPALPGRAGDKIT
jgi:hypothetical protein